MGCTESSSTEVVGENGPEDVKKQSTILDTVKSGIKKGTSVVGNAAGNATKMVMQYPQSDDKPEVAKWRDVLKKSTTYFTDLQKILVGNAEVLRQLELKKPENEEYPAFSQKLTNFLLSKKANIDGLARSIDMTRDAFEPIRLILTNCVKNEESLDKAKNAVDKIHYDLKNLEKKIENGKKVQIEIAKIENGNEDEKKEENTEKKVGTLEKAAEEPKDALGRVSSGMAKGMSSMKAGMSALGEGLENLTEGAKLKYLQSKAIDVEKAEEELKEMKQLEIETTKKYEDTAQEYCDAVEDFVIKVPGMLTAIENMIKVEDTEAEA